MILYIYYRLWFGRGLYFTGKVLEMLYFVGYYWIWLSGKCWCSRDCIVRLLTNSNFSLFYKGLWKIWHGEIVGVGFCGVGIEFVGFIREF